MSVASGGRKRTLKTLMFKSQRIKEQPNMEILEDRGPWNVMNLTNKIKTSFWHLLPTQIQPSQQRRCRPMKLKVASPGPKTLDIPFCFSFLRLLLLTSQKYVFFYKPVLSIDYKLLMSESISYSFLNHQST